MGRRQVEEVFSKWSGQSTSTENTLKNLQIRQKNEEKPCSTCLQPISPRARHFGYPKPEFREPVMLPLISTILVSFGTLCSKFKNILWYFQKTRQNEFCPFG